MASGLSSRIKTILDRYMDFLVRQKILEVKGALRKNDPTGRFERELANLLTIYGSRVLDSEMKISLGADWQGVRPSYFEQLFEQKTVLVQGLMSDIELEFQRNMGRLIGQWMTNEPDPRKEDSSACDARASQIRASLSSAIMEPSGARCQN